jgi:hypothetical protein
MSGKAGRWHSTKSYSASPDIFVNVELFAFCYLENRCHLVEANKMLVEKAEFLPKCWVWSCGSQMQTQVWARINY